MPFCASPFIPPWIQTAPGETATISVYVDGGSRYESSGNNGAAHFLSSLAFSGKNAAAADSLGVFTATAGREQTVYTAKVFKNDVAKAMEVLADAVMGTKVTLTPPACIFIFMRAHSSVWQRSQCFVSAQPTVGKQRNTQVQTSF